MKNWYDVVDPHKDIKECRLDQSVFAADLGDVVKNRGALDYKDPYIFFKRTYFTKGILNYLKKVNQILNGESGDSVIEIQTPFGGGKTHTLITIYHYIKNSNKVKELLPEDLPLVDAKIAVIVGTDLNPLEGRNVDGLNIKTLWGDIAYQLAGKEGYLEFQNNDEKRISPGKEKLIAFLEKQQPFVLLFDEILEYMAKASGVDYSDTNLASQTKAFLQEITTTMSSLKKAILVASLPSSELEDYGKESGKLLATLEKIFGRVESIEAPVKGDEIYSIITRRLFSKTINEADKRKIINDYFEMYRNNENNFPSKVIDINYKNKMSLAYPFHPKLIDTLREKWGTFPNFQRTRGVLKLLASVLEDLYSTEKTIDFILPGDINFGNSEISELFLKLIGREYEGIIASDIAGDNAKSIQLDSKHKNWKHLAERISTAVFFSSFSADDSKRGINIKNIKLSTMRIDTFSSLISEIISEFLMDKLWYLNIKDNRYYVSKIPNLNRIKSDRRPLFEDKYREEFYSIIKKNIGSKIKSCVWPQNSNDVPDNKEITLVIIDPKKQINISEYINNKGDNFRVNKNTLVFCDPFPDGISYLKEQIRDLLVLESIKKDIESGELHSLESELNDINKDIKRIKNDFSYNLRNAYRIVYVGDKKINLGQPITDKEHLSNWIYKELEDKEEIVKNLGVNYITIKFLKEREKINTKTMLEQFFKIIEYPILTSEEILKVPIRQGIMNGDFGIALFTNENLQENTFNYKKLVSYNHISFETEEFLLSQSYCLKIACKECGSLLIDENCPMCDREEREGEEKEEIGKIDERETEEKGRKKEGKKKTDDMHKEEIYKNVDLTVSNISSNKIYDINQGILMPITREIGDVEISLIIKIKDEGISKNIIDSTIKETISQLRGKLDIKE